MKHKAQKPLLFRVVARDRRGTEKRFLAEVNDITDENARRKIVHQIFADGGVVQAIIATDDPTTYPSEDAKRKYK